MNFLMNQWFDVKNESIYTDVIPMKLQQLVIDGQDTRQAICRGKNVLNDTLGMLFRFYLRFVYGVMRKRRHSE